MLELVLHPVAGEAETITKQVIVGRRVLAGRNPTPRNLASLGHLPLDLDELEELTQERARFLPLPIESKHIRHTGLPTTISRMQFAILWTRYGQPRIVSLGSRPIHLQPLGEPARPLAPPDSYMLGPATTVWLPTEPNGAARRLSILNPHTERRRGDHRRMDKWLADEEAEPDTGTAHGEGPTRLQLVAAIVKSAPLLEFPAVSYHPRLNQTPALVMADRLAYMREKLRQLRGGDSAGEVKTDQTMLGALLDERFLTLDSIAKEVPMVERMLANAIEGVRALEAAGADQEGIVAATVLREVVQEALPRVKAVSDLLRRIDGLAQH